MLTSPTALRDELFALDEDLGSMPGRRVTLLGFRDQNVQRVDQNVSALRAAPGWTVIDTRGDSSHVDDVLGNALSASKLALLLDATRKVPTDAELLIRALHDRRDRVRWKNGSEGQIPSTRMLYVIAAGARSIEDLPPVLARIDIMKFIEAPDR